MDIDLSAQLTSALAGRYEVEREVGAGGMATVFLARDVRHERQVALKVLHPDLAAALGAERFLAEIRTTANLQHPHILPLHDSGEAGGYLYYVMPFVSGETLRARLERETQLPVDDAVRIAREMLSALDYAHRHGVVHRDIKPENILLHDGTALVADFGIALAVTAAGGQRMTQTGLSLGTPQYMSPEQAMGERQIDGRADVYAAGAVLYEMLTGEPPFSGATVQAIVAKVMTERPTSARTVRDTVPPNVDAAMLRSLAKLPADRFATAGQFADALLRGTAGTAEAHQDVRPAAKPHRAWRRAAISATIVALLLATAEAMQLAHRPPAPRAERFEILIDNAQTSFGAASNASVFSISGDGSRFVYSGRSPALTGQFWVRDIGDLVARPIGGTENGIAPALSPDGASLAFTVNTALKVVNIGTGTPVALVPIGTRAPAWSDDGRYIYFVLAAEVPAGSWAIARVPAGGGRVDTLARVAGDVIISSMSVLPGGHAVVARLVGFGVEAIEIPSGTRHPLVSAMRAEYSSTGHLIYSSAAGTLLAAPFDVKRLAITGAARTLGQAAGGVLAAALSVGGNVVLYATDESAGSEMVWLSRNGTTQPLDTAVQGNISYPSLSPDGSRLAYHMDNAIWVRDLARGSSLKLVPEFGSYPSWTADGQFISYYGLGRSGSGSYPLFVKRADGGSQPKPLLPGTPATETVWSSDGKWLLFRSPGVTQAGRRIYKVRASADTTPTEVIGSRANTAEFSLSHDGKWLVFASDETGRYEVYVVPFPDATSARWIVSSNGGSEPQWSHSGKEIFYRDGKGNMMRVAVQTAPTFTLGASTQLFAASLYRSYSGHHQYTVTNDDQRFLMVRPLSGRQTSKLVLLRNWMQLPAEQTR